MEDLKYIPVRQPFFAALSDSYKKYTVNKYGIVHFFQFTTSAERMTAVPDGSVDMVFCCSNEPFAFVQGTVLKAEDVPFLPNKLYFGVRFILGYNPILGENAMGRLINNRIDFRELISDEKMLKNIFSEEDFEKQIKAFTRSYMSIFERIRPMDKSNLIVRHSINMIFGKMGNVTVEQLAEETGYTSRYINQCFRREISMSPKAFIKIIRFQSALDMLHAEERKSLSEIASSLGYFDQPHFVKEFKEFSGITPKKYEQFLDSKQYSSKIEMFGQ